MIRIITDSAAELTLEQAEALGVDIVPLNIYFGDEHYQQEQDPGYRAFYARLNQSQTMPTTSQPSPEAYAALYREAQAAGDSAVVICLSSQLSGTYQSAILAKDLCDAQDIHIVDTLCAIMGQRILVEHAVALRKANRSAEEIAQSVLSLSRRIKIFGLIDTLKYLAKGGRMPKSMAAIGMLLHIKPIITLLDGAISMVTKSRGYPAMLQQIQSGPAIDRRFPVYFGYSDTDTLCRKFMEAARNQFNLTDTGIFPVGGLVGSHVGPNCVAIAYVMEEDV